MMAEEIKFTVFYNECYCLFSLILLFLCHFASRCESDLPLVLNFTFGFSHLVNLVGEMRVLINPNLVASLT